MEKKANSTERKSDIEALAYNDTVFSFLGSYQVTK